MLRVNEHSFIRSIHRLLPSRDLLIWKINDQFAGGVPDAYYAGALASLFAEYKYLKALPKRPTTVVKSGISELQKIWLSRMHDMGHNVIFVVGWSDWAVIIKDNMWQEDLTAAWYDQHKIRRKDVAGFISDLCCIVMNDA